MTEWQPISTAPKDGSFVDLWDGYDRQADCKWSDRHSGWVQWGLGSFDQMGWDLIDRPATHWMPLPNPPEEYTNE